MSNVPSIFSAPSGQSGGNNSNANQPSNTGGYVPSQAAMGGASSYASSSTSAAAGGYAPSQAAMGMGGASSYTPSAAASSYSPSATASSYTPSAAASSYSPSATASSHTPSATTSSYTPSAVASSYNPSATASSYTPSSAAATSSYTPSAAATTSYNPSATAKPYNPTAAGAGASANTYTPSAYGAGAGPTGGRGYTPSAVAVAPSATPAFSECLNVPPSQQQQVLPPASAYVHGGGPTHGVISQSSNPVICHKIDYEIKGFEMQLVEIHLDPQETVVAEAGGMMYLEDDVDFKTKFGDGSEPKQGFFKKLMVAGGRMMTGESLFITHFTNTGTTGPRIAAFAAPYPGTILPIDMMELQQRYPSSNPDKPTSLICQKDAFLCAAKGTKLSIHFNKKLGSGMFGGEGFILQKLSGDGMAFCHAGGCVIKRELTAGQRLRVDTGCLVGFTSGIQYDIAMAPGLKTMFFGGEGLFLVTLQGEGTVWLQSLPFSRLADRVIAYGGPGGKGKGESTPLGGLLDGDGFGRFQ